MPNRPIDACASKILDIPNRCFWGPNETTDENLKCKDRAEKGRYMDALMCLNKTKGMCQPPAGWDNALKSFGNIYSNMLLTMNPILTNIGLSPRQEQEFQTALREIYIASMNRCDTKPLEETYDALSKMVELPKGEGTTLLLGLASYITESPLSSRLAKENIPTNIISAMLLLTGLWSRTDPGRPESSYVNKAKNFLLP